MGFKCHATGEVTKGQRMHLVPIKVRKVTYIGVFRPNPKEDFLQFGCSSEGWEIVKEIPIAEKNYAAFVEGKTPEVVGEKEVRYMIPRKKREKTKFRKTRYSEDDEDSVTDETTTTVAEK